MGGYGINEVGGNYDGWLAFIWRGGISVGRSRGEDDFVFSFLGWFGACKGKSERGIQEKGRNHERLNIELDSEVVVGRMLDQELKHTATTIGLGLKGLRNLWRFPFLGILVEFPRWRVHI